VFSGDGGLFTAGRWNLKGRKIIYASQGLALATMEWLAHNGLSVSAFSYHKFSIEIPDNQIQWFEIADLPEEWNQSPATDQTRQFSENELFGAQGPLAIAVPSVMIPEEFNILINPLHQDYSKAQRTIQHLGEFKAPSR